MEMPVYEGNSAIGSLYMEEAGLYYDISCRIEEERAALRRVYAVSGMQTAYLGIPDEEGTLKKKLPKKHMPNGVEHGVCMKEPKGDWSPWRGEIDGILIAEALLRQREDGFLLALSPEEAFKFPAWANDLEMIEIFQKTHAAMRLDQEGKPLIAQIDRGGTTDEALPGDHFDCELPADLMPDDTDSFRTRNEAEGREADCPDL